MRAEFLAIPALRDASWRYHVRTAERFEFSFAFHDAFELVLITAGNGRRLVGDSIEAYGPGDLVLIAPEVPHTWESAPDVRHNQAVIVQFERDWGGQLWEAREFEAIAELLRASERGVVFDEPPEPVTRTLQGLGALPAPRRTLSMLGVLQSLAEAGGWRPLASLGYSAQLNEDARRRVARACRFMHASYDRKVTLAEVAELVHMSPSAFSRFFRRAMGRTLTDYLNELRVGAACRLLVETDLPVTEIASRAGYHNLSHFNRQFRRRKGVAPRAYRVAYENPPGWRGPR